MTTKGDLLRSMGLELDRINGALNKLHALPTAKGTEATVQQAFTEAGGALVALQEAIIDLANLKAEGA